MKFLICSFLVVMGKKGRNNKEIIPLGLVQYHQYQKRISFARARYFYANREKWLCYETKRQTGSFYRYSLISGLRRLGSPSDSPLICGGFPYPSPRGSQDRKTLSPSRHLSLFLSFPESARTAALSLFHNVREVAHESKFECPFEEAPHALFFDR